MSNRKESRIGERKVNSKGLNMEIVEYKDAKDMTVRFDDGAIREHIQYQHFKSGHVSHPDTCKRKVKKFRVGEVRKSLEGYWMEITEYRDREDLDIKFQDGATREHISYYDFISGAVAHPSKSKKINRKNRYWTKGIIEDTQWY